MNKKQIDRYVTAAFKVLNEESTRTISDKDNEKNRLVCGGVASKKMAGKVAAFGPTVISMGVKPAVTLFSKTGSEADRVPVVNAVFNTLREAESGLVEKKANLLDCVKDLNGEELHRAKREILDASVAVKLVLRTYPEKKPESR